jgi:hypothetical protein
LLFDIITADFQFIICMMDCVAACVRDVNALSLTIFPPFSWCSYYEKREGFNIMGYLKNPMVAAAAARVGVQL